MIRKLYRDFVRGWKDGLKEAAFLYMGNEEIDWFLAYRWKGNKGINVCIMSQEKVGREELLKNRGVVVWIVSGPVDSLWKLKGAIIA